MAETPCKERQGNPIDLRLNGESRKTLSGNLIELLEECGLADRQIAIEHNGVIVPRSQYCSTSLDSGDSLEIVHCVAGG